MIFDIGYIDDLLFKTKLFPSPPPHPIIPPVGNSARYSSSLSSSSLPYATSGPKGAVTGAAGRKTPL